MLYPNQGGDNIMNKKEDRPYEQIERKGNKKNKDHESIRERNKTATTNVNEAENSGIPEISHSIRAQPTMRE